MLRDLQLTSALETQTDQKYITGGTMNDWKQIWSFSNRVATKKENKIPWVFLSFPEP